MEKLRSTKGKVNLLHQGYVYRLDRVLKSGRESWRCVIGTCKGRIYVCGDECTCASDHNHVPDPAKSAASLSIMRLRERAATSNDPPRRIIQETQLNLQPEAVALLPKYHSLQRTVQRKRNAKNCLSRLQVTIKETSFQWFICSFRESPKNYIVVLCFKYNA
ncbi:uncharacterized protein [Palaemon carinicauda]|uniref:uncharacterized protein n=1 Tax=Palaemon carinicauda TaxID=392227 RepID=UPI0035B6A8AA